MSAILSAAPAAAVSLGAIPVALVIGPSFLTLVISLLFVCGVVGRLGSGITSVGPRRPPSAPCRPLRPLTRFGWVTKDTSRFTDQVTQVRNGLVHCQSCIWSSLRVCCLFCGWQQLQSLQNVFLFCMYCVF